MRRFSTLSGRNRQCPGPSWALVTVPSDPFEWFLGLSSFLTCTHWSLLCWMYLQGPSVDSGILPFFSLHWSTSQLVMEKSSMLHWVWWLMLCVSLTGLKDSQLAGKTSFLSVSVGCFQKRSAFDPEDMPPSQTWVGIIQSVGGLSGIQKWARVRSLSLWAGKSIFSYP